MSILKQLDAEKATSLAESALTRPDRHWILEEVARAIVCDGSPTAPRRKDVEGTDYRVDPLGTVTKMVDLFHSDFFHHLGLEALASIARRAEARVYRQGGLLCRTGEPSDSVFVICEGTADVFVEREGKNIWTNAVGTGDSIGELGVLTRRPRSATVVVSSDGSRIIAIAGDDLLAVLRRDPRVAMSFLKLVSARQQGMLAKLSE